MSNPEDEHDTAEPRDDSAAEAHLAELVKFARSSATAFQGAMQFATQAELMVASTLAGLHEAGLTIDDIAYRVGLARETVERLLGGSLITHRFI